jgi:putative heme iron utilization protein
MLDPDSARLLRSLVHGRDVAALATLHEGRPFASMIPFAARLDAGRLRLITHVSRLAAHTRDMLVAPEVCLLITAPESADVPPQALPRVSIAAVAEFVPPDHPDFGSLKACYLEKFPHAADLFLLGDFSIVVLDPTSARFIGGFARAMTLNPESLAAAVAAADARGTEA